MSEQRTGAFPPALPQKAATEHFVELCSNSVAPFSAAMAWIGSLFHSVHHLETETSALDKSSAHTECLWDGNSQIDFWQLNQYFLLLKSQG